MPNGERNIPLADACLLIRTGQTFKASIEPDDSGDLSVILPRDILDGSFITSPTRIASAQVPMLSNHLLVQGDILITNKGIKFGVFLYENEPRKAIATASFYVITPDPQVVLPRFLFWYLNQPAAKEYFLSSASGSTILSITKNVLSDLMIPCPPLSEQRHLIDFITETDNEQRLLKELQEKKKAFNDRYIWELISKKQ